MKSRNTVQKRLILDAINSLDNHPTSEDIYNEVAKKYQNISLGTIYRNLNILADNGSIRKIVVPGSADRFDKRTNSHYHIRCSECLAFEDVLMPYMEDIDSRVGRITGFVMEEHDIVFSGICPNCVSKGKKHRS